jgi:polyhydroxyalkanoate synthesis regulator phasin
VPADPAENGTLRSELERLILAAVGAVALTGERADALADELAARGQVRRDEARETIDTFVHRWRGDASRFGERAGSALENTFRELGLVPRRDIEEQELRLAQLEHRVRLLESAQGAAPAPPTPPKV